MVSPGFCAVVELAGVVASVAKFFVDAGRFQVVVDLTAAMAVVAGGDFRITIDAGWDSREVGDFGCIVGQPPVDFPTAFWYTVATEQW